VNKMLAKTAEKQNQSGHFNWFALTSEIIKTRNRIPVSIIGLESNEEKMEAERVKKKNTHPRFFSHSYPRCSLFWIKINLGISPKMKLQRFSQIAQNAINYGN